MNILACFSITLSSRTYHTDTGTDTATHTHSVLSCNLIFHPHLRCASASTLLNITPNSNLKSSHYSYRSLSILVDFGIISFLFFFSLARVGFEWGVFRSHFRREISKWINYLTCSATLQVKCLFVLWKYNANETFLVLCECILFQCRDSCVSGLPMCPNSSENNFQFGHEKIKRKLFVCFSKFPLLCGFVSSVLFFSFVPSSHNSLSRLGLYLTWFTLNKIRFCKQQPI